ncbi:13075_t:CDS:2 [Acaulospora colombiana]|uniref:13075_t:CDS:1 n=1 Tax=Acaulospora colombiana TaxID=27376 RepID=A0ACA9L7H8_9GLOM|nr:13075_t:CDS:2 [Acaulospora colombiana]
MDIGTISSDSPVNIANNSSTSKLTFEFTINNVKQLDGPIYSPPFGTSSDIFWQLKFVPVNTEHPTYCSLFLVALLNKKESMSTGVGQRQHILPAMIYLRDPTSNLIMMDHDSGFVPPYLKKCFVANDKFTFKKPQRGAAQFFPRSKFPDDLIIGVGFRVAQWQSHRIPMPFPVASTSDDLISAWEEQLNRRDIVDVQFNIDDRKIYASSSLLSKRSVYFARLFQQQWAESMVSNQLSAYSKHHPFSTPETSHASPAAQETEMTYAPIRYNIEITDFDYDTFLTMLRFLYTGRASPINPNNAVRDNVLEVFAIADKYLISELRQRAMAKIDRDLTPETAGDVLFGWAWKWPDLKEMVTNYIVKNFGKIRKTQEWKSIGRRYPTSAELMEETLTLMIPDTPPAESSRASGKK